MSNINTDKFKKFLEDEHPGQVNALRALFQQYNNKAKDIDTKFDLKRYLNMYTKDELKALVDETYNNPPADPIE